MLVPAHGKQARPVQSQQRRTASFLLSILIVRRFIQQPRPLPKALVTPGAFGSFQGRGTGPRPRRFISMMYRRRPVREGSIRARRAGQNVSVLAVVAVGVAILYFWGFVSTVNRTFGPDK